MKEKIEKKFEIKRITQKVGGVFVCGLFALPAVALGKVLPVVGAPVFGILLGILFAPSVKKREFLREGILFTSKKILQLAVILLGFGMNLTTVVKTGILSLPVILSTISVSLLISFLYYKATKVPYKQAILVGVGSSICGGSAIAATAPIIGAKEEEVAQAISVIFLFNVLAAFLFPMLGSWLGLSNAGFALFAGTAINDTSSVTAAASTWDTIHHTGTQVLDGAAVIKMTRTLAIIPITLILGVWEMNSSRKSQVSQKKIFPVFILLFLAASLLTTMLEPLGVPAEVFLLFKSISKVLIVMAMVAIGLHTNLVQLIRTGARPLLQGFLCWVGITLTSLIMQNLMGIW